MIRFVTEGVAPRWQAYCRRPFPRLVRLFMNRIFHGNSAGEDELNLSMGLVLVLLAIPGGFISIFLFNKYGSLLQWLRGETNFDPLAAALPDEYFFIVLSMVVTGGVAVWWWDSIMPDRRDFMNLVPLPISTLKIFLANAVAILLLACLFAMDVNAASSLLFPALVGWTSPTYTSILKFAAIHALVVVLASMFSFFAVFATVGVLMVIFPYAFFRRISLYARVSIVIALLTALSTSGRVPRMILELGSLSDSPLKLLPCAWFLGFCQLLRGKADPALAGLGHIAIAGLLGAFLIALLAYAVSYRRSFSRIPELSDTPPGKLGTRTTSIFRLLDLAVLGTPFQRAGYRFVAKTLVRKQAHALALGGFVGLGMVVASHALFSAWNGKELGVLPSAELLSIPLMVSYSVLVGLSFVFDIPADLGANWIFRFLLDKTTHDSVPLARRVMLILVLPPLVVVAFPIYLVLWGWAVALFHTLITLTWSVLLSEILLTRFRKLPFTCTYPPFRHSAVVTVIVYVLGFFAFAPLTSEFEREVLEAPIVGLAFIPVVIGIWHLLGRFRRGVVEIDSQIIFEDLPHSDFELLHLAQRS